jgi:hypothetical protein
MPRSDAKFEIGALVRRGSEQFPTVRATRDTGDGNMEMDDDFMGEIEFDLSAEQGRIVSRAISLAANMDEDEFRAVNPLLAIMQWWEASVPDSEKRKESPEASLAEACRRFLLAHGDTAS